MSTLSLLLVSQFLILITKCQLYCDQNDYGNNGWCSNDVYASRNLYLAWLTSICIGTCLILWFEKKLIFLSILWYITLILFIFSTSSILWFLSVLFDLVCYFLLFQNDSSDLDPFGDIIIDKLLNDIIYQRLIAKRDEKLHKKEKDKKKLLKESRRKKTEFRKFENKQTWIKFKNNATRKWLDFKGMFNKTNVVGIET